MPRRRPQSSTSKAFGLVALAALGLSALLYEFVKAPYVVALTFAVGAVLGVILRRVRRSPASKRLIPLLTIVTMGFWVSTTTALRLADSGDSEDGPAVAMAVATGPWSNEMSAAELMRHGIISTIAFAAIAFGLEQRRRKSRHSHAVVTRP